MNMQIDVFKDNLITLPQAAKRVPGRNGKGVHPSTLFRWASRGLRGKKLATKKVAGTRYTTIKALQNFLESSTEPNDQGGPTIAHVFFGPALEQRASDLLG